jgi:cytosine/adenosine deaminase-related metal-dependent hydrolase
MILRARVVVTMNGPPIEDGAVAISRDRLVGAGKFAETKARHSGKIVDLGERVLLPGLINAHCHLDYTCMGGEIPRPQSFTEWVGAINAEKAKLSEADYRESIRQGFAEAKKFGTTTIVNLTAFPELIAEVRPPIRTWWFAELIDVRAPERANELVDLAVERLKPATNWGLAPHALYTASANLYHRCEDIARRDNVLLTTHLAESHEEMAMFRDGSGPLYEFLKEIGRDMSDCGKDETPVAKFAGASGSPRRIRPAADGRALPSWIIAHLNELTESDFALLEKLPAKFHIVHSPRSHAYFGHSPFQFERLRQLGFDICLGTDSLASNDDLSLFAEMRQFAKMFPSVSPDEILRMVTVNPAQALRQGNALGKICPGARLDFVAVPFSGGDVFEEIIAFAGESWVVAGGEIPQQ